ncbi:hypothetical protein Tco_1363021 [Tanacetum coccineum]
MGDSTGVSLSLGGGISLGGKKSQESNVGDSDNTRDGGTIVGGGIVTCVDKWLQMACMTSYKGQYEKVKELCEEWNLTSELLKIQEEVFP